MRTVLLAMLAAGAAAAAHAEDRILSFRPLQLPGFQPKLVQIMPMAIPGADCDAVRKRMSQTQYPRILGELPPARLEPAGSPTAEACLLPADRGLATSPLAQLAPQPFAIPLRR